MGPPKAPPAPRSNKEKVPPGLEGDRQGLDIVYLQKLPEKWKRPEYSRQVASVRLEVWIHLRRPGRPRDVLKSVTALNRSRLQRHS